MALPQGLKGVEFFFVGAVGPVAASALSSLSVLTQIWVGLGLALSHTLFCLKLLSNCKIFVCLS